METEKCKKYELTDDTIKLMGNNILHRIKALKDFGDVKAGDLGGYIEKEDNLSHEGNCWVYDDAMVYDNARVYHNAKVLNKAKISRDALVFDNARVSGRSMVIDKAWIYGNATIDDEAVIYGAHVYDNAIVFGNAEIWENAEICKNAIIKKPSDYLFIKGLGSEYRGTTAYRDRSGGVTVKCGCFNNTLDEFKERIKYTHKHNKYAKEYMSFNNTLDEFKERIKYRHKHNKYAKEYMSLIKTIKIHFDINRINNIFGGRKIWKKV